GFDVVHVPIVPEPTAQRGNGTQTTDKGTSPPPPAERFPCCRTRAVPALSRHFGRVPVVLRSWPDPGNQRPLRRPRAAPRHAPARRLGRNDGDLPGLVRTVPGARQRSP